MFLAVKQKKAILYSNLQRNHLMTKRYIIERKMYLQLTELIEYANLTSQKKDVNLRCSIAFHNPEFIPCLALRIQIYFVFGSICLYVSSEKAEPNNVSLVQD